MLRLSRSYMGVEQPAQTAGISLVCAVVSAIFTAVAQGPAAQCSVATEAVEDVRVSWFALGLTCGVALLPLCEAFLLVRRIWSAGLAATVGAGVQPARPQCLPVLRG